MFESLTKKSPESQSEKIQNYKKHLAVDSLDLICDRPEDKSKQSEALYLLAESIREMSLANHENNLFQTYILNSLYQMKRPEYYIQERD